MVDIQSPTTGIRRGKKKERKKEETTGQKYNVRICLVIVTVWPPKVAKMPKAEKLVVNISKNQARSELRVADHY